MRTRNFLLFFFLLLCSEKLKAQVSANFTADKLSGCAPIRVQFTDNSTGSPNEWRWDLGNGTLSPLQNPSTTYFTPGTYTVRLVAKRGNDSSVAVKTNYITVFASPVVSFSGTPLSGCLPLNVAFTDASTSGAGSITSWKWDFGDGLLGTGQNPTHTYVSQGKFQVTLTLTNSNGCITSDTKTNYVTAFDSIKAKFGVVAPNTCTVPATFTFVDSSKGANIILYEWNFGDGTTSNQKSPSHTYTSPGIYDVSLRLRNSNGCEDIIIKKGIANAGAFKADFALSASACINKPTSFINTSNPIALLDSSRWTFGNGAASTQINPSTTYTATGSFPVKLVSKFGACADSVIKVITVLPKPTPAFTGSPTGSCKGPLTVNFTNMTTDGTVVKWDFGNGDTSILNNPSVTYRGGGTFDVKLIVKSPGGCTDTLIKKNFVRIQEPVIEAIDGLPWRGCFPWTNQFGLTVNTQDAVTGWHWDFGDGTTSTEANPVHSYIDTGTYNVTAIITTSQGCTDTITSTVHGGSKPNAMFEGAPRIVCPLDAVNFKDLSTGDVDGWFWEFGDGGVSSDKNPQYKYTDTGWMTVVLTVFSNGCADTTDFERYIYVNPPIAKFVDSFVCGNQFKHLFFERAIGADYWKWYVDGKDSMEAKNITYTFTDTGLHKVKLYVSDEMCEHESIQDIFVLNEKAGFTTKDSGNCTATTVTFTAEGPKTHHWNIKSYEWLFGDNTPPLVTDTFVVKHEYKKKGLMTIRLIITDLNGCRDTLLTNYNVRFYGPQPNFGPKFTAICAGSEVTFTDSTATDITNLVKTWTWDFGDGTAPQTYSGKPFKHIYNDAGYFDVKLTVVDNLGCTDSLTRKVAVGVYKPRANFVSPDTVICINSPVNLINTSTGSKLKSSWDFGNGLTASTFDGLTKYAAAGTYNVRLIVSDSINCKDTLVRPKYIFVGDAVADFTLSDSFTTCPPLVVSFTNRSVNNASSFWDFGNGNSSSLTSPSHTYTTPGVFNVKLLVTGYGGCEDSISKKIAIQGPRGSFSYGPLGGCPPLLVQFESDAINTRIITWDFSDGNSTVTTDSSSSHVYEIPGVYVPKVIFADTIGCKLPIQGPDTIRVVGAKAFIESLKRFNYCDTATISFFDSTVTTDVVVSYLWTFGDGTSSTDRNPVHFYDKPGNYEVVFEVRTLRGCTSRDTLPQKIIIAPTPKMSTGPNTPVCVPSTVQFNATWSNRDTATLTYDWNFGNGKTSSAFTPPPVMYDQPGSYLVRFMATNRYGCSDTADLTLKVNDTPRVSVGPASFLCRGSSASLKATGASQYQWKPTASLSCLNCDNPVAKPAFTEIFTVTGIDSNSCRATKSVELKVKQPAKLSFGPGDTLCVGESYKLSASGTEQYLWSPAEGLSSTVIASPTATPTTTTKYMVVGYDSLKCFYDTGYVSIVVYPIPQFNILEDQITASTGTVIPLKTTNSADITRWHWSPPTGLSCTVCAEPNLTVSRSLTYTARVFNDGGCTAQDKVTVIPVCSGENMFIPNTFSPNADGKNDRFYPRGRGIALIKSMRIFSRWGEMLFEMKDFSPNDPSKGWDGSYKGAVLTPDVYVYMVEVVCDNNVIFTLKGNVTLLK